MSGEPGFLRVLLVWGGNLFGGMGVGAGVNALLAPGSDWGWAVGAFALPLVFGIGMKMWYAAAAGAMANRLMGALLASLRRRSDFREEAKARLADLQGQPIPGTGAFVLVGLLIGPLAGLLTAFAGTAAGILTTLPVWAAMGLAYGLFLRWLARSGHLPLPDEA